MTILPASFYLEECGSVFIPMDHTYLQQAVCLQQADLEILSLSTMDKGAGCLFMFP